MSTLYTPILIALGAVALFLSILRTKKILNLLTNKAYRSAWRTLCCLMLLFLAGYLAAIFVVLKNSSILLSLLLGVVFFFGALFVYLVVRTGHLTIADLEQTTISRDALEDVVSERTKQLNEANARLAKLDAAKTDFISVISHELRTPLTIVKGYTQILNRRPLLADDNEVKTLFKGVMSGIERLQTVVSSVLDLARLENSDIALEKAVVSPTEIIEATAVAFASALEERKLNLNMDALGDLPRMTADHDLLCKMFHHLLLNAIKFTPDGGSIRLAGKVADNGQASSKLQIEISDTGIGIDPKNLEVIFEKFYQTGPVMLHSSGSTNFKAGGPGLGLTIARLIARAHGGDIHAESEGYDEEKCPGSRFIVTLPLDGAKEATQD